MHYAAASTINPVSKEASSRRSRRRIASLCPRYAQIYRSIHVPRFSMPDSCIDYHHRCQEKASCKRSRHRVTLLALGSHLSVRVCTATQYRLQSLPSAAAAAFVSANCNYLLSSLKPSCGASICSINYHRCQAEAVHVIAAGGA